MSGHDEGCFGWRSEATRRLSETRSCDPPDTHRTANVQRAPNRRLAQKTALEIRRPTFEGVREILRRAADVLQNKLTRAQYLDEVTWTTKSWLGLQKQRISVVLHTAIAEQVVNELACGGGGRVHGAKCLATLAGVA